MSDVMIAVENLGKRYPSGQEAASGVGCLRNPKSSRTSLHWSDRRLDGEVESPQRRISCIYKKWPSLNAACDGKMLYSIIGAMVGIQIKRSHGTRSRWLQKQRVV